jgi:hypothetical protein
MCQDGLLDRSGPLPVAKSRRYAPQKAGGGLYFVSVPNDTIDKLEALRGLSESLSDVIIRLAMAEGGQTVTRPFFRFRSS